MDTIPSFARRTAARSQPMRPMRRPSRCRMVEVPHEHPPGEAPSRIRIRGGARRDCVSSLPRVPASARQRTPATAESSICSDALRWVVGGEIGIRTLGHPLDSVTYRFYTATVATTPRNAIDPCTLVHAGSSTRRSDDPLWNRRGIVLSLNTTSKYRRDRDYDPAHMGHSRRHVQRADSTGEQAGVDSSQRIWN